MTERPILYQGAMVRAILNGSKTQTRRVAKLTDAGHVKEVGGHRRWHPADPEAKLACPYGQPGDRLWVRESFRLARGYDKLSPVDLISLIGSGEIGIHFECNGHTPVTAGKIRPSIHMPRSFSRILLEIVSVRVERLRDISAYDCWAEGIPGMPPAGVYIERVDEWARWSDSVMRDHPKAAYSDLWNSINGPGSWDANPWVWVVQFKLVQP